MKIHILDIQDGNGCRLLTYFDQDAALEAARDWMVTQNRFGDPAAEENINDNMDCLYDGEILNFADGCRLHLGESDLDMSGVVEVLADAQHTMAQNQSLLKTLAKGTPVNMGEGLDKAQSRYLATEQAIHLTLQKLKGQS